MIDGQTWDQWARELFEFEACAECGGLEGDHLPAIVMGNWFALCRHVQCPGCPDVHRVPADGPYEGHCARHWHEGRAGSYEGHG